MKTVIQTEKGSAINNKKSGNPKNKSLQGLRAVAILAIFISHIGIGNLGVLGAWGVSVFFVLSGFLMLYNYMPRETIPQNSFGFAWNKIKRLYPLHIVTMLFAAFYAVIKTRMLEKTILDIGIHTLLIQMWIPKAEFYATLNGPSWYLCVSFFLYLMFPLMLKLFKGNMSQKKVVLYICIFFVVEIFVSLATFLLNNHDESLWFSTKWITYYSPPVRLIDFFMGCCLGYLFLDRSECNKNYFLELAVCILVPISLLIYVSEYGILGSQSVKYTLLFLPTSMILLWVVAGEKGVIPKILSTRVFVWLGDLSPYIFLIHGVVLKYCRAGFSVAFSITNVYITATVSLVATIFGAFIWRKLDGCLQKRLKANRV